MAHPRVEDEGMRPDAMRRSAMRRCRVVLALGALLLSLSPAPARADHYVSVCRIEMIEVNRTCHADLVAVNERAGEWLSSYGGPIVTVFGGTYKWRLTWGADPSRNWIQLTCAGAVANGECVFVGSPVMEPITVGDEMTFDADGNVAWGDVGTLLYGVAYREPSEQNARRAPIAPNTSRWTGDTQHAARTP